MKLITSLLVALLPLTLALPTPTKADSLQNSTLAYTLTDENLVISLNLYDPSHDMSVTLDPNTKIYNFSFSIDGRLAFQDSIDGHDEVYVLDTQSADSPVQITSDPTATHVRPLGWSADGRYLAFASYPDVSNGMIYVWDGQTAVNITPTYPADSSSLSDISWSVDGRLAFVVEYNAYTENVQSKIYLWDGNSSTPLTQRTDAYEYHPSWSDDGKLAFKASLEGRDQIYLWDGVSHNNGFPDADTFINVVPQLTPYPHPLAWTNDGRLAFAAQAEEDLRDQIYVWDGQSATNVSQNPSEYNSYPRWSADGRWAFVNFWSLQQSLYVRDADNRLLLVTEGQYAPAWSSDGYLAFCRFTGDDWILSLWDGQNIAEIAQGIEIWAQWQGGERVICSEIYYSPSSY